MGEINNFKKLSMDDDGLFRNYLVADVEVTVEEMMKVSWSWAAGLLSSFYSVDTKGPWSRGQSVGSGFRLA